MSLLKIQSLYHSYGKKEVIKNLHFHLKEGEILSLLGPSACGKTTLLRLIAGFEKIQSGKIYYGDLLIHQDHFIPPHLRQIGMVFQESALFPHLTVQDNILFALKSWKRRERMTRLKELLSLFLLESVKDCYPHQLSGGQEKRVAVARALSFKPQLLLMDEPFTHLDGPLKEELILDLKRSLKKMGSSVLFVTHDPKEAFSFSDCLGIFKEGVLHQRGKAQDLYERPKTPFVFQCLGPGSALPIQICEGQIRSELGGLDLKSLHQFYLKNLKDKKQAWLCIRPEQVTLDCASPYRACVQSCKYLGASCEVELKLLSGVCLKALLQTKDYILKDGEKVGVRLEINEPVAFEKKPI